MKVAVIGAGVAGLRLARRLAQAGDVVTLFEKARGPSGRASTRRSEFASFDHGAQYFTAREPRFVAQVEDWVSREVAVPWEGRVVELESGVIRPEERPSIRYVGRPRMTTIARDLLADLPIELETRIARVERTPAGWHLSSAAGETFGAFDAFVTAVPAPQASPLVRSSPEIAARVDSVRMLPCHALMLGFDPVAARELDEAFDAAFVRSSVLSWVARNSSKPGRSDACAWLLHSDADWSVEHIEQPMPAVAREMQMAFASALGAMLPPACHVAVHRWLFARPSAGLDGTPLWDADRGIGACGDWVQGDRIEDAFVSAERLADAMLGRSGNSGNSGK